jgi:two-component system, chemotaxis family, protein-glutamate methylesterase/glutaminase
LVHYRCHIGHAFSADSLLVEQSEAFDEALDSALRAAEEKSSFLIRLADRLEEKSPRLAEKYRAESQEMIESIDLIRRMLTQGKTSVGNP